MVERYQPLYDRERSRHDHREDERGPMRGREWEPNQGQRDEHRQGRPDYYEERQYGTRGLDERQRFDRSQDATQRTEHRDERGSYGREYNDYGSGRDEQARSRAGGYGEYERSSGRSYNPESSHFGGAYSDYNRSSGRGYNPGESSHFGGGSAYGAHERSYLSDWNRNPGQGRYESRDWHAGNDRGQRQGGREEESFGHQLREAGSRIARSVKRVFRGPKGYKRSDDRIREDVSDRMGEQEHLDCSEIEVSVASGEVTLTGTVRHRHEKFLAEEIADDVSGVTEVHNQLRVKREPMTQSTQSTTETASGSSTQTGTEAGRTRNARA